MFLLVLMSCGAEPAPVFTVENRVPPAFVVVNRIPVVPETIPAGSPVHDTMPGYEWRDLPGIGPGWVQRGIVVATPGVVAARPFHDQVPASFDPTRTTTAPSAATNPPAGRGRGSSAVTSGMTTYTLAPGPSAGLGGGTSGCPPAG